LEGLGLELVPRVNPEALKRMQGRYQRRNEAQIRNRQPINQALIDKIRPIILQELGHAGGIASAKARRQAQRRQANGHAETTICRTAASRNQE
jgi:hypothetical protein